MSLGSFTITLGSGPYQVTARSPCCLVMLWSKGSAQGATACDAARGMGSEYAAAARRRNSFMSPEGKRYAVPGRPCDRSARPSLRGRSQNRSSARHAPHRAAAARAPSAQSKLHGGAAGDARRIIAMAVTSLLMTDLDLLRGGDDIVGPSTMAGRGALGHRRGREVAPARSRPVPRREMQPVPWRGRFTGNVLEVSGPRRNGQGSEPIQDLTVHIASWLDLTANGLTVTWPYPQARFWCRIRL